MMMVVMLTDMEWMEEQDLPSLLEPAEVIPHHHHLHQDLCRLPQQLLDDLYSLHVIKMEEEEQVTDTIPEEAIKATGNQ